MGTVPTLTLILLAASFTLAFGSTFSRRRGLPLARGAAVLAIGAAVLSIGAAVITRAG